MHCSCAYCRRRNPIRITKCGFCRRPGHNRRECPDNPENWSEGERSNIRSKIKFKGQGSVPVDSVEDSDLPVTAKPRAIYPEYAERPTETYNVIRSAQNKPAMTVYIAESTFDEIMERSVEGGSYEMGGWLLGTYGEDEYGDLFIDIRYQVPAQNPPSLSSVAFAFTNQAQGIWHYTKEANFPMETTLGWYHSHPGHGVFLSDFADVPICHQYFNQPHHVAIVVDPTKDPMGLRREASGVFIWENGELSERYDLVIYSDY